MNKKLTELVEHYFELYPDRSELFCTEDGNVFLQKSPAIDHALKTNQKWYAVLNPAKVKETPEETDNGQALKRETEDGALDEKGNFVKTPDEIAAETAKTEEEKADAEVAKAEEEKADAEVAKAEEEKAAKDAKNMKEKSAAKGNSKNAKNK